jgi:hypothetical protein
METRLVVLLIELLGAVRAERPKRVLRLAEAEGTTIRTDATPHDFAWRGHDAREAEAERRRELDLGADPGAGPVHDGGAGGCR